MDTTEDVYWYTPKQDETIQKQKEQVKRYNEKYAAKKEIQFIPIDLLVAAPSKYNVFSHFKENPAKLLEMTFSIRTNGLFNPIIVWREKNSNNYMILSGHTRTKIYKNLYMEAKQFNDAESILKFSKIPAIVYEINELNDLKAKEIIIDTNYLQRDIEKRYIPLLVSMRVDIVRQQRDRQGKTLDIVAESLNMGRTAVYENLTLATKVIDSLATYYYDGILRKKNVIRFSFFDELIQYKIYEECKSYISNTRVEKLQAGMSYTQIKQTLMTDITEQVTVSFKISKNQAALFKKDVEKLIKRKYS